MAVGRPQTVTVLFTDVVASTAWRVRVGDEVADTRTAEFESASRQVVAACGGTVVKTMGDGVMATFDSALAGLDAGAALRTLARRLAFGGGGSCLRVGVSTGDLVRDGDDWLGAAAIEASRLCAEAPGGTVLVADATVRLSRGRSGHVLRVVGERALRGFDTPLEIYELVDRDADRTLPVALARVEDTPLVGRTAERQRLTSLLGTVAGGGAATVFVVGEPGVGKSRLAAAAAAAAVAREFTVLHGRCDDGLAAPYQPVVDAFGPWLSDCPDAALARFVGDGADLVNLWPELASRLADEPTVESDDPEGRRWRLFEALGRLVRAIAGERPLLLVIDDLHWAEPSTLLLLGHLVRRAVPGMALIATVRSGEPTTDAADLLGDIGTDRSVELIDLGGLGQADVSELVARHSGGTPPDDLSAELHRYTDGNPLFLAALLAHLDEVAFVRSPQGVWASAVELESAGVPHGVRGVIARRVARLGTGARRVLNAGAVSGLAFDPRVICGALDVALDEVLGVLDAAVQTDLLREETTGRYAFAHALVRQAVLDDLSRTLVASLHWRIAEQLERTDPTRLGEIAYHFVAGRAAGDDDAVARSSLAAGDDAMQRAAFEEAADHFRTALEALDRMPVDHDRRYQLLASLGRTLNALVLTDEAQHVWLEAANIAREARDPERTFAAVQGYGYVMRLTADAELIGLLDDVLDMVGPADSPLRASALGWRAVPVQNIAGQVSQDDVRRADDAVAMARRTGQSDALISTLHSRLLLETQSPDAGGMLRDAEEVVASLETGGPGPWDHTFAKSLHILALLRLGRRADAERRLGIVAAEADRAGLRLSGQRVLQLRSSLATASGQFADGKRLADAAAHRSGTDSLVLQLSHIAQGLVGRVEIGRLEPVIAGLRQLEDVPIDMPGYRAMRARVLAEAGLADEAQADLERLVDEVSTTDAYSLIGRAPMVMHHLPEVCRSLGDTRSAAMLLDHVARWRGQVLVGGWGLSIEGAADRAHGHLLATLGRLDDADAAYTAAADLERSAGFPPLCARTQYWHARALLERDAAGDQAHARDLLDDVVRVTADLGMKVLHRDARELLDDQRPR